MSDEEKNNTTPVYNSHYMRPYPSCVYDTQDQHIISTVYTYPIIENEDLKNVNIFIVICISISFFYFLLTFN